jgi:hypothetical protein
LANTGYDWGSFSTLQNAVTLTRGGTVSDTSDAVSLDLKAGCEVGIDAAYSNHAKATAGLSVYVLRSYDGTNYEVVGDLPWGFEMPFTQNASHYRVFSIDPGATGSFKLLLVWGNTTASSNVTVTTAYRTADVSAAS